MNRLSQLPSVDRLLSDAAVVPLIDIHGRAVITQLVRATLADAREAARAGTPIPDAASLVATVDAGAAALALPRLRPVFNLTGTVLHTNLGRAPLPPKRPSRQWSRPRAAPAPWNTTWRPANAATATTIVSELLSELTGAEAATVVNNNAAAVLPAAEHAGAEEGSASSRAAS